MYRQRPQPLFVLPSFILEAIVRDESAPAPAPRRTVSVERAGQILGVSRRTVYYRIRQGLIETKPLGSRGQRVYEDTLTSSVGSHGEAVKMGRAGSSINS